MQEDGPVIYSSEELIDIGYPRKERPYNYLVYGIQKPANEDFNQRKWDVRKVRGFNPARTKSTEPLFVSLAKLMEAEV